LPFAPGQLTGPGLTAVIETACAHCSRPVEAEVTSSPACRVISPGAAPVIRIPQVNSERLRDLSIIHAF
jgi:hypothetical protein